MNLSSRRAGAGDRTHLPAACRHLLHRRHGAGGLVRAARRFPPLFAPGAPRRARRVSSRYRRAHGALWLVRPAALRMRADCPPTHAAKLHPSGVALIVWTAWLFRTVDGDGPKLNAAPTAPPRIG